MIENKIYHRNFLDNELPDKCANLIIADPPYFQVKGEFDFIWNSFDDYLKDVEKWALECKRILADNGTLFWWGMDRKIAYAQIILDRHLNLIGTPVWEKPSNPNEWDTRRTFPERAAERLLMYCNAAEPEKEIYKPIMDYIGGERKKAGFNYIQMDEFIGVKASSCYWDKQTTHEYVIPTKQNWEKLQETGFFKKPYETLLEEYKKLRKEYEEIRRAFNNYLSLTDVLRFSRENNKYNHDTKKPEKLTRALILTCSRLDDLVVVPFSGSGTECAMSAKEGRRFIGFDIEKKYVDMGNKRTEPFLNQMQIF
jgi:site-specific DNA-methyltransferase (adenine-specific)